VPDHGVSLVPIAHRSLEPILLGLAELLHGDDAGCPHAEIYAAVAEAYVAGHIDGQRHAVGEVAPEAARRGLHLRLAPALEDDGVMGSGT
jgi:hypothetical protein